MTTLHESEVAPQHRSGDGFGKQIAVVAIAGCALLASLIARFVLPENFLRDDGSIQTAMVPEKRYLMADSFQGVGTIYKELGLQHAAPLAGLLSVGLFVVCVFAACGWERLRNAQLTDLAAIAAAMSIGVVYLGQFSKELVTVGVCTLLLLLPRGRAWDVAVVIACIGYGASLRSYWLIIAGLYVVWRVALARVQRPALLLLIPVLVYIALQPAFGIVLGGGLQSQRESVNSIRDDPASVESLIVSPIADTAGPVGVLSAVVMVMILLFPVPLLAIGSLYHAASALLILGVWLIVLIPVARGRLVQRPGSPPTRSHVVASRGASLLFALLLVQALFEPDFGSYLKHLTPLLPLVLALLPEALGTRAAPPSFRAAAPSTGPHPIGELGPLPLRPESTSAYPHELRIPS